MSQDQRKYTNKLEGKHVLVLGGTSGIGYCVAEALVEHGAHVIVSSSNADRVAKGLERLQSAYPSRKGDVLGFSCNLGDDSKLEENVLALLNKATGNGARKLDHIISTAGDAPAFVPLASASVEQMKQGNSLRMLAPLVLAKHAPHFVNAGPEASLTFTTGSSSQKPIKGWTLPSVWFGAHHTMTTGLALDLAPLRVNLVSPGVVDTEMWGNWGISHEQKQAQFNKVLETLPTGRVPSPDTIAEAYLYLLKDSNVTGTCISTNGGGLIA